MMPATIAVAERRTTTREPIPSTRAKSSRRARPRLQLQHLAPCQLASDGGSEQSFGPGARMHVELSANQRRLQKLAHSRRTKRLVVSLST
jgi:hypothetical protein